MCASGRPQGRVKADGRALRAEQRPSAAFSQLGHTTWGMEGHTSPEAPRSSTDAHRAQGCSSCCEACPDKVQHPEAYSRGDREEMEPTRTRGRNEDSSLSQKVLWKLEG